MFVMTLLGKEQRTLWDRGLTEATQTSESLTLPLFENPSEVNPDSLEGLTL